MAERDVLRPALELALQVAAESLLAQPPEPFPAPLMRFLGFRRLSGSALDEIARIVDGDERFRERVGLEAEEATVGPAGKLWLQRPPGWREELEVLLAAAGDGPAEESRTKRQLARTEEARRAAERDAAAARLEASDARAALGDAQGRIDALERELEHLRADVAALADERARAIHDLKEVEARAVRAAAERNDLRRRLAEAEQARSALEGQVPDADDLPPVDLRRLRRTLEAAAATTADLAGSLGEAAAELRSPGEEPVGDIDLDPPPAPALPVRRPLELPGGVVDDGVEAAQHLVRQRGAVLVVDGYNVSMRAWGDRAPAEQRTRLLDALGELSARTGIQVDVVFDGPDEPLPGTGGARNGVRVRFSGPDRIADDVVVELCEAYPAERPVVVASSDNEVRDGARSHGANLLHADQLLAAAGRA